MKIFIIDNNVDGLLSALYTSFTEKIMPDFVVDKKIYQQRLDCLAIEIKTDFAHAERVKTALYKYGGDDVISHLKVSLLSCDKNALSIAFNYAYLMLKRRENVCDMLSEKAVSDFSFLIQKVLHERHIVLGFLRFEQSAKGVMYAKYVPDNDITELIAPHFLRRLGKIPFIIHDAKRNKIAISNGKSLEFRYTDLPSNFVASENEKEFHELYRKYFQSVNIKERKNSAQQDRYFPRRYRKYCFETWE